MELVQIPAGTLIMGDNRMRDASPQHKQKVGAFAIGKYPVTNAEYGEFLAAGGYETEAFWTGMGWKWQRGRLGKSRNRIFGTSRG